MKHLHLIPDGTKFRFLRLRKFAYVISGTAIVLSIITFFAMGLNYGIDFKGGTLLQIETQDGPADIGKLRTTLRGLKLGDVQIQLFGKPTEVLIRIEQQRSDKEDTKVIQEVKQALGDKITYHRVETVGAKVSGELVESGVKAVSLAILAVLVYIWFRFEWQFGVGAVVALVHDVVLTIGVFSALQLEFNLSIIAAILTIVGYSLNDTVVVYDRVRENLRRYKKMPLVDLIDKSLNDTLSRTLMTSLTTLIALGSLYAFGGEVIRGFTFGMIWGIVVGTYSSIFIASPVLMILGVKRDWNTGSQKPTDGNQAVV
ncbi:MAG: protein translocase subunit SecF [Hyphomicrobiales bacterium]|nr:MAG: protein translocase subunit SecF [Hyphomicrobiales bacterium]